MWEKLFVLNSKIEQCVNIDLWSIRSENKIFDKNIVFNANNKSSRLLYFISQDTLGQ